MVTANAFVDYKHYGTAQSVWLDDFRRWHLKIAFFMVCVYMLRPWKRNDGEDDACRKIAQGANMPTIIFVLFHLFIFISLTSAPNFFHLDVRRTYNIVVCTWKIVCCVLAAPRPSQPNNFHKFTIV